jgi:hypothetical protein
LIACKRPILGLAELRLMTATEFTEELRNGSRSLEGELQTAIECRGSVYARGATARTGPSTSFVACVAGVVHLEGNCSL